MVSKMDLEKMEILKCHDLKYSIGTRKVLKTVNFSLNLGDLVFLEGGNGAGKSTLLRVLSSPEVSAAHLDWKIQTKRISYLGHEPGLYLSLSLRENLKLFSKLFQISPTNFEETLSWAGIFGLEHRLDDPIYFFSRGMLQKSAILRTFLFSADLFLLDEPFTGLDKKSIQLFLELLKQKKEVSTIVLVSHGDEAKTISNRTWKIERGELHEV